MSEDVEDRRGGGGFGFGGGGLGIVGVLFLLVISLVTGRNYLGAYLSGAGGGQTAQTAPVQQTAAEDRSAHLVSFTLDDVQRTWARILAAQGVPYRRAHLVLYRGYTTSACGMAQSATGPFYCPADEKVYIDLGFWEQLARFGGSTADFAQAYVIAHELGHHVQNLLGTEQRVRRLEQAEPGERNHLSVDVELQADCFAGVWAHDAQRRGIVHPEDVRAGLSAAAAVGDDHLQRLERGTVQPDTFTHGTSAQREHWFEQGLTQGTIAACNTFSGQRDGE